MKKRKYPYSVVFECRECAKGTGHTGTICKLKMRTEIPSDFSPPEYCPVADECKWKRKR